MKIRGFTLIELLVVIAVLAVLAALMAPAVGGAMDRSKSSKCISNLRQVGAAALMYAAEKDGRLPPISSPEGWWPTLLSPYLGSGTNSKTPVWRCPAVEDSEVVTANGNTHYGYGPCKPIIDFSTSSAGGSMRLAQLPMAPRIWLFGDIGKPVGGLPALGSSPKNGFTTCGSIQRNYLEGHTPAIRHNNGTMGNVVFCDGHVETHPWSVFEVKNNELFGYNSETKAWDF